MKHSILSGLFAALAALFGKLATSPDIFRTLWFPSVGVMIGEDYLEVGDFNFNLK